ncbi:MAG: [citrate (pro-3S)-lyase] ligase [Desulfovibrio sp.]|jgi:[citrate (pro-3S)-lyase] ligase|nr:[citrate (pro-3S)-lyase] ligase [Desulfovibrio sp.]
MNESFVLRDMQVYTERGRSALRDFLASQGLRYENDADYAVGVYDDDDVLLACGCCCGAVLKNFAVAENARGQNILGRLLSHLTGWQFQRGNSRLLVFTTPENKGFFLRSGFFIVEETAATVLLENRQNGVERFAEETLPPNGADVDSACVVMNCNPFTLGHRHLVEYAAARSALLHVFLVEEDRSIFPFAIRKRLLSEGTADIPNVRVYGGGPYIISSATFPTYFLKEVNQAADVWAELDLTLFARRIAPLFHISRRYVGEEPYCILTRKYNEAMRQILPRYGLSVESIPRLRAGSKAVSASAVREILARQGACSSLRELVPESTLRFLESEEAAPVLMKLRKTGNGGSMWFEKRTKEEISCLN